MHITQITSAHREQVALFLQRNWGSAQMIVSSGTYQCEQLDGFIVEENNEIIGLITYVIRLDEIEIISLDSLQEGKGIGSALMNKVEHIARQNQLLAISLITTNDNLNALKFYQKRSYRMVSVIPDAVNQARKLKPSIPLIGNEGIPLTDELQLRKRLTES
ncbi:GNAT family N-acetyltransferase [Paenibacillus campi]|uniref:GNAT family N-acetyltransferase n=1 Tax=Paenibacillus campi TaxID=3106031 RepID=UPI002AFE5369|nr:GNAT family N-acetyltransferase [Paenibacillus sp. SGZ-1009]